MSKKNESEEMISTMEREIKRLKSIPKDQACEESKKSLIRMGIIDANGNVATPYQGVVRYAGKRA